MQRTTKLNAVNTMLSAIGESPVASIDSDTSVDAELAIHILDETLRAVMLEDWEFNTEEVVLSPDEEDFIYLPGNYLRISVPESDSDFTKKYTQRGDRVYELKNNTYKISGDLSVIAVIGFDWEDCPEYIRYYVMIRAARVFQDRRLGDQQNHLFTMRDQLDARSRAVMADTEDGEYDIFDNEAQAQIIARRGRPYRPNG